MYNYDTVTGIINWTCENSKFLIIQSTLYVSSATFEPLLLFIF